MSANSLQSGQKGTIASQLKMTGVNILGQPHPSSCQDATPAPHMPLPGCEVTNPGTLGSLGQRTLEREV